MTTDELKSIADFRVRYEPAAADDLNAVPALAELWETPRGSLMLLVAPSGLILQAFTAADHSVLEQLQQEIEQAEAR